MTTRETKRAFVGSACILWVVATQRRAEGRPPTGKTGRSGGPPMSAPPEFWEQLLKKMTAQEAASVAPVSAPEVEE